MIEAENTFAFGNPFVFDEKREPTIIERRVAAAQATLDRFRDVPFEPGKVDCVQVAKWHCRQLGRPMKFGKPLSYKTLMQGRGVLRRLGFASIGEALGSLYPAITPAAALVGDLMELPALQDEKTRGLGALVIYLGNNAVFGFHEIAAGGTVMRINEPGADAPIGAWRLI